MNPAGNASAMMEAEDVCATAVTGMDTSSIVQRTVDFTVADISSPERMTACNLAARRVSEKIGNYRLASAAAKMRSKKARILSSRA